MLMVKTYACVIGVVQFNDKVLLLKRTPTRKTSPNKWQPPSGYIGEREAAEDGVLREVKEETGLCGQISKAGKIFEVTDKWGRWVIMSFLVNVKSDKVILDKREHSEMAWIRPADVNKYDTVRGVKEDLKAVGLF